MRYHDPDTELVGGPTDALNFQNLSQSFGQGGPSLPPEVHSALAHALSGAVGSSVACLATYPLDLITKRLQVQRQVQRLSRARSRTGSKSSSRNSRKSTKKGHRRTESEPVVTEEEFVTEEPDGSVTIIKKIEERAEVIEEWDEEDYEAGSDEYYDGVFDACEKINYVEGWGGFYTGVFQDLARSVGNSFWYFATYNYLRQHRARAHNGGHIPVLEELAIGIAAGAVSKFFVSPISTIVTRKQTAAVLHPRGKTGVINICQDIMQEKGITGFWSGYTASLILTLNPSITFVLYESLKSAIISKKGRLRSGETFLLAAVSKAVATGLTYPFAVARTRCQVTRDSEDYVFFETHNLTEEEQVKAKKKLRKNAKKAGGVLHVLVDIIRREGVGALYDGVGAEVMKGFFSHGVSILIKESIHRAILSLYFTVLKAYHLSEDRSIKATAKLVAKEAYEGASATQKKIIDTGYKGAQKVGGVFSSSKNKVGSLVTSSKERILGRKENIIQSAHVGIKEKIGVSASALATASASALSGEKKTSLDVRDERRDHLTDRIEHVSVTEKETTIIRDTHKGSSAVGSATAKKTASSYGGDWEAGELSTLAKDRIEQWREEVSGVAVVDSETKSNAGSSFSMEKTQSKLFEAGHDSKSHAGSFGMEKTQSQFLESGRDSRNNHTTGFAVKKTESTFNDSGLDSVSHAGGFEKTKTKIFETSHDSNSHAGSFGMQKTQSKFFEAGHDSKSNAGSFGMEKTQSQFLEAGRDSRKNLKVAFADEKHQSKFIQTGLDSRSNTSGFAVEKTQNKLHETGHDSKSHAGSFGMDKTQSQFLETGRESRNNQFTGFAVKKTESTFNDSGLDSVSHAGGFEKTQTKVFETSHDSKNQFGDSHHAKFDTVRDDRSQIAAEFKSKFSDTGLHTASHKGGSTVKKSESRFSEADIDARSQVGGVSLEKTQSRLFETGHDSKSHTGGFAMEKKSSQFIETGRDSRNNLAANFVVEQNKSKFSETGLDSRSHAGGFLTEKTQSKILETGRDSRGEVGEFSIKKSESKFTESGLDSRSHAGGSYSVEKVNSIIEADRDSRNHHHNTNIGGFTVEKTQNKYSEAGRNENFAMEKSQNSVVDSRSNVSSLNVELSGSRRAESRDAHSNFDVSRTGSVRGSRVNEAYDSRSRVEEIVRDSTSHVGENYSSKGSEKNYDLAFDRSRTRVGELSLGHSHKDSEFSAEFSKSNVGESSSHGASKMDAVSHKSSTRVGGVSLGASRTESHNGLSLDVSRRHVSENVKDTMSDMSDILAAGLVVEKHSSSNESVVGSVAGSGAGAHRTTIREIHHHHHHHHSGSLSEMEKSSQHLSHGTSTSAYARPNAEYESSVSRPLGRSHVDEGFSASVSGSPLRSSCLNEFSNSVVGSQASRTRQGGERAFKSSKTMEEWRTTSGAASAVDLASLKYAEKSSRRDDAFQRDDDVRSEIYNFLGEGQKETADVSIGGKVAGITSWYDEDRGKGYK
ncbi:hypothetical protein RUND412_003214 [Rhizina undulata]